MRAPAPANAPASESTDPVSRPSPLRYAARLGIGATYFLNGSLLFIFPAWAQDTLGFSESTTGGLLLVRMAVATLGFSLWGRWDF